MHASLSGSHDGAPGGQSALDTHLTHRPVNGLQRGVPEWQSESTTHSTHVPFATSHRRPSQSASCVQTTQRPRAVSQIFASPTHSPPSTHSAMQDLEVGSHMNPGEQSALEPQATQMRSVASQCGAVPSVHCSLVTQATH